MSSWKLLSWNVNGVRAVAKKGFIDWIQEEVPDILCIQETKSQESQLDAKITDVDGYTSYWSEAEKKGYSGVGVYTRHEPISVHKGFGEDRFDSEGRTLVLEYPDFTLFNVYFPNGKQNATRLKYKMDFYAAILAHWESLRAEGKKLVICGDVNTAHKAIDLARPKGQREDFRVSTQGTQVDRQDRWTGIRGYVPRIRHGTGQIHLVASHVRGEKAERGLADRLLLRDRRPDARRVECVDPA